MKKQKKIKNINVGESPKQSLEKILKAEIKVAQRISAAKEEAEKRIDSAGNEIVSIKKEILKQARIEREKMLADSISNANKAAQVKIKAAEKASEIFLESGRAFLDEAVQDMINIVIYDNPGEN